MNAFTLCLGVLLAIAAMTRGQSKFYEASNIVAVEQKIQPGQSVQSLDLLRQAIGLSGDFSFQVLTEKQVSNGLKRQELQLLYKEIPIRIARLQASVDKQGRYTGAVSGYYPDVPASFDVTGEKSESQLKSTLLAHILATDNVPSFAASLSVADLQDFRYSKEIDINIDSGALSLVYFVRAVIDIPAPSNTGVYLRFPRAIIALPSMAIQKSSFRVLLAHQGSSSRRPRCPKVRGGSQRFPGLNYGDPRSHQGDQCVNAKVKGGQCKYSNKYLSVFDAGNSFNRTGAGVVSFDCKSGPNDETNEGYSPATDAFYYSQSFYKMLHSWAGISKTKLECLPVYVHYGNNYANSFFDGRSVCFGDGVPGETNPFVTPEIVGHEMAHSLTSGFNNLLLGYESLVMNEVFSDVIGKGLQVYENGYLVNWKYGEGIFKPQAVSSTGKYTLRHFDTPSADGEAIENLADYDDSQEAYYNMGIYTRFFYDLVAGKGFLFRDALETFVQANQFYWAEESTLIDGACGLLRAASDLGLDTELFRSAFADVGFNMTFCSLQGTRDVITCNNTGNRVTRHGAIVSQDRNPSYILRACAQCSSVKVTVSCPQHVSLYRKDVSGDVDLGRSAVISLASDVEIYLKSSSISQSKANLRFKF